MAGGDPAVAGKGVAYADVANLRLPNIGRVVVEPGVEFDVGVVGSLVARDLLEVVEIVLDEVVGQDVRANFDLGCQEQVVGYREVPGRVNDVIVSICETKIHNPSFKTGSCGKKNPYFKIELQIRR